MSGPRRWRLVRARSDAVPASVRRFNQRAQQRRMQAARPWLVRVTPDERATACELAPR